MHCFRRSDHDEEEEEETHGEEDDHSSYRSNISNTGNESPLSVNSRISLIGTPIPGTVTAEYFLPKTRFRFVF